MEKITLAVLLIYGHSSVKRKCGHSTGTRAGEGKVVIEGSRTTKDEEDHHHLGLS